MRQTLVFFITLQAARFSLCAQQEIISVASDFIVVQKYSEANHYLDSILKKNPSSVDALMMKGNVILNLSLDTSKPMQFVAKEDESIFSSVISEKPKLLSRTTVLQIEEYWKRCLQIDSSRVDIQKGLCSIYAMALMKDSLKRQILRLLQIEKDDGEQAYRIAEYARKFKERNKFDEAIEIYEFIATLYPELAGTRCDIASEYFDNGQMEKALQWLDSCFNFKAVDETSFLNGAFIYSELGNFDAAQNVLNIYSNIYQRKMDIFYYGLRLFADTSANYSKVFEDFCATVDTNSYFTEVTVARKILALRDSFSFENYKTLATDPDIPDYYKMLIHERGLKQFKDNCEFFVHFGIFLSSIKNYEFARELLFATKNCKLDTDQSEYRTLHLAYATFRTGELKNSLWEKEHSLEFFEKLLNSRNAFIAQAAMYFSVKILIEQNNEPGSRDLHEKLIVAAAHTKYLELPLPIKMK